MSKGVHMGVSSWLHPSAETPGRAMQNMHRFVTESFSFVHGSCHVLPPRERGASALRAVRLK